MGNGASLRSSRAVCPLSWSRGGVRAAASVQLQAGPAPSPFTYTLGRTANVDMEAVAVSVDGLKERYSRGREAALDHPLGETEGKH